LGNARREELIYYTNDTAPYGSSQGGAFLLGGSGTVRLLHTDLNGNSAFGRVALSGFFDNNGEDAGVAQGGAIYVSMPVGSVTIDDGSTLRNNQALGSTGGNSNGGSHDLAGEG